ncbi:26S proteasome, regulatory subunit Rpn7 [Artemisia annua]|uniref:26S proteasome, regulatory subunit Rpn7 n=1 Tax=Artemisia annua TaxID=35608 RepID=A0A2U1MDJ1_ARTAN|nr:26S proteasome, regulatory subunit Rpn7 [Artemisia annua]
MALARHNNIPTRSSLHGDQASITEGAINFVKELEQTITNPRDMAPLYESLGASGVLEIDQKVLDDMRGKIVDELNKLDEK